MGIVAKISFCKEAVAAERLTDCVGQFSSSLRQRGGPKVSSPSAVAEGRKKKGKKDTTNRCFSQAIEFLWQIIT